MMQARVSAFMPFEKGKGSLTMHMVWRRVDVCMLKHLVHDGENQVQTMSTVHVTALSVLRSLRQFKAAIPLSAQCLACQTYSSNSVLAG